MSKARQDYINENCRESKTPKEGNLKKRREKGCVIRMLDTKKNDNPKTRNRQDEKTKHRDRYILISEQKRMQTWNLTTSPGMGLYYNEEELQKKLHQGKKDNWLTVCAS